MKKRKDLGMLITACAVLLLLPIFIVAAAGPEAGMLLSIMLLLVVDPFFFLFLGMYGAKKGFATAVKGILFSALAFAAGALAALGMGIDAVAPYTAAYVLLALAAMGITSLVMRKKKR